MTPSNTPLIRMRLDAGKIIDPPKASGFTPADYAQHIIKLKARMPKGFSYVIQAAVRGDRR